MGIAGIKSLLHSSHIFLVLNTKTNSRQKYSSPSHILSLYFDLKPLYLSREHLEQYHCKQIWKYITTPRECYHKKGGWAWAGCVCKCQQCWRSTFSFLVCDSTPKMCAGLLLLRVWFQLCKRDRNTIFLYQRCLECLDLTSLTEAWHVSIKAEPICPQMFGKYLKQWWSACKFKYRYKILQFSQSTLWTG